jgi:hypothetical protein
MHLLRYLAPLVIHATLLAHLIECTLMAGYLKFEKVETVGTLGLGYPRYQA